MTTKKLTLAKPVYLVGFMGAGKTTVSRRIARDCGLAAIDLDRYMERQYDHSAKELFLEHGEDAFRELEAIALTEAIANGPVLVSCGGGIVAGARSCDIMRSTGFVIHMLVRPHESRNRISDHSTRPFFENSESVNAQYNKRLPQFNEVADATIDTAGKPVGRMAAEIEKILRQEGVLCPAQE